MTKKTRDKDPEEDQKLMEKGTDIDKRCRERGKKRRGEHEKKTFCNVIVRY